MGLAVNTVLSIGDETAALCDMPLAPLAMTGRPRPELARNIAEHLMSEHLRATRPATGADALRALRSAFPDSSLSARVAALAAVMRP